MREIERDREVHRGRHSIADWKLYVPNPCSACRTSQESTSSSSSSIGTLTTASIAAPLRRHPAPGEQIRRRACVRCSPSWRPPCQSSILAARRPRPRRPLAPCAPLPPRCLSTALGAGGSGARRGPPRGRPLPSWGCGGAWALAGSMVDILGAVIAEPVRLQCNGLNDFLPWSGLHNFCPDSVHGLLVLTVCLKCARAINKQLCNKELAQ